MIISTSLLFLFAGTLNTNPSPIFTEVYIGTQGPYHFLVDTGAETSLIDPELARKLNLKPEFRAEVITQQTTRKVPGLNATSLRVGQRSLPSTELLFYDVSEARRLDSSVQGVLGLNALKEFDFTLSPKTKELDSSATRPAGEAVPFYKVDGRMAVKARMGEETLTLILDSGSTNVVLFHTPAAMAKTSPISTTFTTLDGARAVVPTTWTADLFFTNNLRFGTLPAAIVARKNTEASGLLPASLFKKIYVDQARQELVLVR